MKLLFLGKIKKNHLTIAAALICIGAIIGYCVLFLFPVISKLTSLFRDVADEHGKIVRTELFISGVPGMKNELKELGEKIKLYADKLPNEEEFPVLLESLSDVAKNAGVKITKILPIKDSPASASGAPAEIYFQRRILINAQCGYHQLGTFIAELENAKRFMEVSNIKIEATRTASKRHNMQLIITTFVLPKDS